MNIKSTRQLALKRLIAEGTFQTQRELLHALEEEGFSIKQGTLSKDLEDLMVTKTRVSDRSTGYSLSENYQVKIQDELLKTEIQNFVLTVVRAANLVVVKTASGRASSVCETIDQMDWPELAGSVAGENTILLICKTNKQALQVVSRFHPILKG